MGNKSDFAETRDLFRSYTNYSKPLSFDEWNNLPRDHKAAVLYLQFYDQVTLAWIKLKSVYSVEADGVAEALQYLEKNVSKIEAEPKRFTPNYIYRVMYNCLYCLCRDPNRYKAAYENECSNVVRHGEDELDLFDTVASKNDEGSGMSISDRELFWKLIEDSDLDTKVVVAKLLGEDVIDDDKTPGMSYDEYQKRLHESWHIEIAFPGVKKYPEKCVTESDKLAYYNRKKREYEESRRQAYIKKGAPKARKTYSEDQMNSISEERFQEIVNNLRSLLGPFLEAYGM